MKSPLIASLTVALAVSVSFVDQAPGQTSVFAQAMTPGGGTLRTSSFWVDPGGQNDLDSDSQAWEDFTLTQTATVSRLRWWGQTPPPLGFTVSFYNQDPNTFAAQPHIFGVGSGPLTEEEFAAPSIQSAGGGLYQFTVDLDTPLTFEAGTRYFVSVIGLTPVPFATWSWAQGQGTGSTFWWSRGAHMYFSLPENRGVELFGEPALCPADITGPGGAGDGNVDALDFLMLIGQWGTPCAGNCEADITGPVPLVPDGSVDALDILLLIAQWGSPGSC